MKLVAGAATPAIWSAQALGEARAKPRVVVVGAGIIGVSIAYHLAGRGAEVTLVDKGSPGGGATQGAFAMLIATHDESQTLNALYGMAVRDWRRLEAELRQEVKIQWGGTCAWAQPGPAAEALDEQTRKLVAWGAPIHAIDAGDLQRLVPGVEAGPFGAGNFSPYQGTLDPSQALEALLAAARARGARLLDHCEVISLQRSGETITAAVTTRGLLAADAFVLAAGADTPKLAGALGVTTPIDIVSGTLAHSAPFPRRLHRVLNGPAGSLKQDPDGRIVIGPDYRPGANGQDVSRAYGEQLLEVAGQVLPALRGAHLERMTLGFVPIPKDGAPIIGFCRDPANLYVALTMSGVTMAPIMGRFAAVEIVDRVAMEPLSPYRPARFV
ncbi:MAG TPA: FAD-binding oxidoreductase [Caulobacteraceae bacterium]|nr:FAD-binding oxidoreductase [Caulobacteraceae bacterium]